MKHPLIIDRPEMQSKLQLFGSYSLTVLFWMLWFTVWIPVVTSLAWALGIHVFISQMYYFEGIPDFFLDVKLIGMVIALLVTVQIAWAKLNELRFRGKSRRQGAPTVTRAMMADYFEVDTNVVYTWRRSSAMVVDFDAEGNITVIEPGHLPAPFNPDDTGSFTKAA